MVDLAHPAELRSWAPPERTIGRWPRRRLVERLASLYPGMLFVLDLRSSRFSYIDPGLTRLLGHGSQAFNLELLRRALQPAEARRLRAHYATLRKLSPGQSAEFVLSIPTAHDEHHWLKVRSRPFVGGKDGRIRRIIGTVTDISVDHQRDEALESTSRRLVDAEETERRRIGRELHDSTIQHLVAIDLLLGNLEQRNHLREDEVVVEMRETLVAVQREIRTFAFLLHPPNIDEQGLEQTLRRFCAGFARRTGLAVEVDMRLGRARLSFDAEVALFRISQEALMNVHRHAGATTVSLRLRADPREVHLEIADDGKGMTSAELASAMRGAGVGVGGMRARVVQLGGALSLDSNSAGLVVRAHLPLRRGETNSLSNGSSQWSHRSG